MSTGLCSDETHAFIPTNLPDPGPSLFSVGSIKLPTLIFVRKGCREVVLSIAWCLQLLLSTWKYTNLHGGPKKSKPQRHKVWLSSQKGWNAFQSFEVSWACSWEKLDRVIFPTGHSATSNSQYVFSTRLWFPWLCFIYYVSTELSRELIISRRLINVG